MSLTIGELLLNHTKGIPSTVNINKGEYFDTEIPVFHDITEEVEHKRKLAERLKEFNEEAKKQKVALDLEQQKEKQKAEDLKFSDWQKKQEKTTKVEKIEAKPKSVTHT